VTKFDKKVVFLTRRLRDTRQLRGWSQYELERRSGINQKSISNYERGVQTPSAATLHKLADALGVSSAYLLGQTNNLARDGPLPPGWAEVIAEAIAKGLTPAHLQAAMRLIDIARTLGPHNPP
jgi:transcriptional regulator with XRE-family HTH domain